MRIRKTRNNELAAVLDIYARARGAMARQGNPHQWGSHWPPAELIRQDIAAGRSYVCEADGRVVGVFYFAVGPDMEPTYRMIEDGAWLDDSPYGVVHRLASDGSVKGVGRFCLNWAFSQCGHLRADTHPDNETMKKLLPELGFIRCGLIRVARDDSVRLAFEKPGSGFDR